MVDLVGASVGLIVLLLLFVPIAVAIGLDSPGPIIFRQKRYGLHGQPFQVLKFRSMVDGADACKCEVENEANGPIFKNRNDPRVTRVGRFLRSKSLDELPQFWNILMGEMSLVGTRPPTEDEILQYGDRHWQRLNVKPGLTGEWQVCGRSSVDNFEDILDLDLAYQAKWTPIYDLQVLWQTVLAVLFGKGAW
ncbi:sugar transferase [Synechococcus sp. PCC 7336]|uniref:sugar transferase n=1 Tax=Synechococcus sp. PCC 7336 TaxID=195250 RepID=UPI0003491DE7|nr:sugar transferase [Synechococcus sp. PCC 7336]